MVNQGVLEIRFHEKGRILLTPLAKKILFEGQKVKLARLQLKPKTPVPTVLPQTEAFGLFEELKKLRKNIAIEENVPAYIVFNDASLKDMEQKVPKTQEEFLQISGVGEVKNEKYGEIFLKAIKDFLEHNTKVKSKTRKKTLASTYFETYDLYKEGLSVEEIAEKRELTVSTIHNHLIKLHQAGNPVDLEKFITSEEIKQIVKSKKEVSPDEDALKPIFEHFEEKVPYWKIRMGLYLGLKVDQ